MRVAILQSNYIPWKGYFDIIGNVDLFIFHDDLQYTKGDWRNRNKIKTPNGPAWLTIPVGTSEKRLICDVEITDSGWQERHYRKIEASYRKGPYYNEIKDFLKGIYLEKEWKNLSQFNQKIIVQISRNFLKLNTLFDDSRNYSLTTKKEERVLELLKKVGATSYLSGPSAKDYLNPDTFIREGIQLFWMDYSGYPEYTQLYPPFYGYISIIDMLIMLGSKVKSYMKIGTMK